MGGEPESEVWDRPKGRRPPTPQEDCPKGQPPLEAPPGSSWGEVPAGPPQPQPANAQWDCWDLRAPTAQG
eukprot:6632953-Prorocentrum_lima.AAC.1